MATACPGGGGGPLSPLGNVVRGWRIFFRDFKCYRVETRDSGRGGEPSEGPGNRKAEIKGRVVIRKRSRRFLRS